MSQRFCQWLSQNFPGHFKYSVSRNTQIPEMTCPHTHIVRSLPCFSFHKRKHTNKRLWIYAWILTLHSKAGSIDSPAKTSGASGPLYGTEDNTSSLFRWTVSLYNFIIFHYNCHVLSFPVAWKCSWPVKLGLVKIYSINKWRYSIT